MSASGSPGSPPRLPAASTPAPGIFVLLANRRYTFYLIARVLLLVAAQMLSLVVGWQLYEITGQPLALGLSGFAIFLPVLLLTLPAGQAADLWDRRWILIVCLFGFGASAA